MAQIDLYRGGYPKVLFPACSGQNEFKPPFPQRVAGEYGRGFFTLGFPLHPAVIGWQADKLEDAQPGDIVNLLVIPEHTLFHSAFLEVEVAPELSSVHRVGGCLTGSMVGVSFEVEYQLHDNTTYAPVGAPTTLMTVADAAVDSVTHMHIPEADQFVPTGQTMLVGVRLTTAPTTPGATFATMAGRISLVAKVSDYQVPWQL